MFHFVKKSINILKVGINCIAETSLMTMPISLSIEPTNYCTKKCLMCPNGDMTRGRGYMDLTLFKKIVSQSIDYVWEYGLNMMGEPTLHRDLKRMVEYIKSRKARVTLYTNMNYQKDSITEWIVKNCVDRVVVNVPANDQKLYQKIVENGDYDLLFHNLAQIKKIKKRKPVVVISYLVMKANENQYSKDIIKLKDYADYVLVDKIHDWIGNDKIASLKTIPRKVDLVKKCTNIWTTIAVLWDGRVAICCRDYEGKTILGDMNKEKISTIFNSMKMKQFRKEYRTSSFCKSCYNDRSFQFSFKNLHYHLKTAF